MKYLIATILSMALVTGCNTSSLHQLATNNDTTNEVTVVNSRWFWTSDTYTATMESNRWSLSATKSSSSDSTLTNILSTVITSAITAAK
jgi:hypothetical protein